MPDAHASDPRAGLDAQVAGKIVGVEEQIQIAGRRIAATDFRLDRCAG